MGGGLFDEFGLGGLGFGKVEAGDLETVEEEASAAGVDVVGGDALEDLADDKLNAGPVVEIWKRDLEGGAAAPAGARVGGGFAGGVVVEAEVSSPRRQGLPQRWPSVKMWRHWKRLGVSVCGVSVWNVWVCGSMVWCIGPSPTGYFLVQSLRKKRVESGLRVRFLFLVKNEGPAFGRAAVVQFL
jgi:hypothetical protein